MPEKVPSGASFESQQNNVHRGGAAAAHAGARARLAGRHRYTRRCRLPELARIAARHTKRTEFFPGQAPVGKERFINGARASSNHLATGLQGSRRWVDRPDEATRAECASGADVRRTLLPVRPWSKSARLTGVRFRASSTPDAVAESRLFVRWRQARRRGDSGLRRDEQTHDHALDRRAISSMGFLRLPAK